MYYASKRNTKYRGYQEFGKMYVAISANNTKKSFSIGAISFLIVLVAFLGKKGLNK